MTDNPTKFHRRGSQTVATYKEQSQTQTNKQTNKPQAFQPPHSGKITKARTAHACDVIREKVYLVTLLIRNQLFQNSLGK